MKRGLKFGLISALISLITYFIIESISREIFLPIYIFKYPNVALSTIGVLIIGFLIGFLIYLSLIIKGDLRWGIPCAVIITAIENFSSPPYFVQVISSLMIGFVIGIFLSVLFKKEGYIWKDNFSDIKKTLAISGAVFFVQLFCFFLTWFFSPFVDASSPIFSSIISIPLGSLFLLFTQMSYTSYLVYILLTILCFVIYAAVLFGACLLGIKLFKKIENKRILYGILFIILIVVTNIIIYFVTNYFIRIFQ